MKKILAFAICSSMAIGFSSHAEAYTNSYIGTPTFSGGKARHFSDSACFDNYFGTVTNTCTTSKIWVLPVFSAANLALGTSSVRLYTYSPVSGGSCYASGHLDPSSSTTWWGTNHSIPTGYSTLNWGIPSAANWAVEVYCTMPQGSRVGAAYIQT